jgi:hypothetical protein
METVDEVKDVGRNKILHDQLHADLSAGKVRYADNKGYRFHLKGEEIYIRHNNGHIVGAFWNDLRGRNFYNIIGDEDAEQKRN